MSESEKKEIEKNIEKAKVVSEYVKDLPIGPLEKQISVAIATLGGNPVPFLVDALSYYETMRAERENPAPELPSDYTPLERIIHEMLIENTGASILDSGALYGRHWERNRKIVDFRKTPRVEATVWKDGWIDVRINVFHFLTWALDRDELCEKLEKEFYEFAEQHDGTWFDVMRKFASRVLKKKYNYEVLGAWNTYNFDCNLLSQDLQGITFEVYENGEYKGTYIMLQIHGGCDVRGGYTKPRFFKLVVDESEFYDSMCSYTMMCDCTTVYVSDIIEAYDNENNDVELDDETKLPVYWKIVQKHDNAENWEYKIVCEKCKSDVEFR